MNQEYHLDPPATRDRLFTRYVAHFELIKQHAVGDKQFVSTIAFFHGSYPTAIIMWYQYGKINSATHGIYVHPY